MTYGGAFLVMIAVVTSMALLDPLSQTTQTTSSCEDAGLLECQDERVQVLSNRGISLTYTNREAEQLSFETFNITSIDGFPTSNITCDTPVNIPQGQAKTITCTDTSGNELLVAGE